MINFFGIIPARYASSRLPGKPLAKIGGVPMIERVYRQCQKSKVLSGLAVATDDERIAEVVSGFGGNVVITDTNHPSGTDRCFEAAHKLFADDAANTVIINVQGDEPFINPALIDLLASSFDNPSVEISTLINKVNTFEELFSPNTVKAIVDNNGFAMYFSRAPIPFLRGYQPEQWIQHHTFYKHIGIYAYRYQALQKIIALKPSTLELSEMLEQLRWLENGFKIHTQFTDYESFAVDTNRDLQKANTLV